MPNKPKNAAELNQRRDQMLREAALEKQETQKAERKAALDVAYTPENPSTDTAERTELESLCAYARTHFPEGADYLDVTPNTRLTAIAHCSGWQNSKIARALGVNPSTISRWLDRPEVKLFVRDFGLKQSMDKASVEEQWNEMAALGIKVQREILSDPAADLASRKLKFEVAKDILNRKFGKPSQNIDAEGTASLINAMEQLKKLAAEQVSEEDEAEIFLLPKNESNDG